MTKLVRWWGPTLPLCLLLACPVVSLAAGAAPTKAAEVDPFYDPVRPLKPRRPRTEQETDKVTSAALFAHGRLLLQRGEHEAALREFQRAWRCSPQSAAILDDVIRLAFRLRRTDVGARYAVIASELKPDDPILLRRLAEHLAEQGDLQRALELYKLAARPDDPPEGPVSEAKVLREIGRLRLLTGRHKQAAAAFAKLRDAIDQPEKSGLKPELLGEVVGKPELIYRLMGESFLLADRYDEAEAMFRRANEAKEDAPELAYRLARVDQKRGKVDRALRQLDKYLQAKAVPNDANPYRLLGELLQEKHKDDADRARRILFERLESLWNDDQANVELGGYLARSLLEADQLDRAEETYRRLEEINPSLQWDQGLIDVQRKRGDAGKLIDALAAAVQKTNTLSTFESALGRVLEDKPLVERVLESGRKRLDDNSLKPAEALALAYVALAANDAKAADAYFAKATAGESPSRNEVLGSWGLELFSAERFGAAASVFQQALDAAKTDDEKARIEYFLASALELDGRTDAAVEAARKAAQLAPNVNSFATRPAWVLYHAQRYDEARDAYTAFVEQHDDDYTSSDLREELREARMILSNICVHLDDMPQAEEWLELVLDEFPEDVGALNDLGYLWADQGKHLHRSLTMAQRAVAAEPDNVAYLDSLGWAHYRLGQYDQAIEHLEKAVAGEQPDGVILDHLGDAYLAAGKREQALKTWRRAVEAYQREQDDEMLAEAKKKIEKNAR